MNECKEWYVAKDHAEVDAFFKAAVDAGGKIKDAPQARPEYYPGYYATWVLDPATTSRSFIKAKLIFIGLMLTKTISRDRGHRPTGRSHGSGDEPDAGSAPQRAGR